MAFLLSAGGSGTDSERVHVAGKVRKILSLWEALSGRKEVRFR